MAHTADLTPLVETWFDLSARTQNTNTRSEMASAVADAFIQLLHFDRVSIWYSDAESNALELLGDRSRNGAPEKSGTALRDSVIRQLWASSAIQTFDSSSDIQGILSKYNSVSGLRHARLVSSPFETPVLSRGLILASSSSEDGNVNHSLRFLSAAAASCFAIIELKEDKSRRALALNTLSDVVSGLNSSLELTEILKTFVLSLMGHFGCSTVAIWLVDGKGGGPMRLAAHEGLSTTHEGVSLQISPDLVPKVVRADRALHVDQLSLMGQDPQLASTLSALGAEVVVPFVHKERLVGVATLGGKLNAQPYTAAELELLAIIGHQTALATRNAQLYDAERKLGELQIVLEISREITSTLDLQRILAAAVNLPSKHIAYDRSIIGIADYDRVIIEAVSGTDKVDRRADDLVMLESIMRQIAKLDHDVLVTRLNDNMEGAEPELEPKFLEYFRLGSVRSMLAIRLKDDEGVLGVWAFESARSNFLTEASLELIEVLSNQVTVAVRNSKLYSDVPMVKVLEPMADRSKRFARSLRSKPKQIGLLAVAVAILLFAVPFEFKVGGEFEVHPAHPIAIASPVDGVIEEVFVKEGERVASGQILARINDPDLQWRISEATARQAGLETQLRMHQATGNAAGIQAGEAELAAVGMQIAWLQGRLQATAITTPAAGTILTEKFEKQIGRAVRYGDEICRLADLQDLEAEVLVAGNERMYVQPGQPARLRADDFPQKVHTATVQSLAPAIDISMNGSYTILLSIDDEDAALLPGSHGHAKIICGKRSLANLLMRRPIRLLREIIWTLTGV